MTLRILLCAALCLALLSAPCGAQPGACPDTISVQQRLAETVPGWSAMLDDMPHRLASITFYDGKPEDKASLVSDQTARVAGKDVLTWRFLPQKDRAIWVACGYSGTAVTLIQSLPAKTSACSVTYNPRQHIAGLPVIEKITCK